MSKHALVCILLFLFIFISLSASGQNETEIARIRLATTTSTETSGLLNVLLPPFEAQHDVKIDVIAVGTGQAIVLGKNGDADMLMVHAPALEEEFMAQGFGFVKQSFMSNDFVVLGPKDDPANIAVLSDVAAVFQSLAASNAAFISRADNSGTYVKELELWERARVDLNGYPAYFEVGQGMGAVLMIAADKQAYTLADRGTFLAYASKLPLAILFEEAESLFNPYSLIAVNPGRHPHVQADTALAFMQYLLSDEACRIINTFQVDGQQLFFTSKTRSKQ